MADRVGQQLGNYRLTRFLGRGGFAEVYLGEHIHLYTQAAIKVLHTQLTSEDVEQFRTEARTLARLVHPQIVRVLDFDVECAIPFLVMDYAPKGSLRERHPRGTALPLNTIIPYVFQVAEALQYAHDSGFIHRDIKPENMLLGRQNEILLSDFGIAVLSRTSGTQSIHGWAGTPCYMAPEQFRGKLRRASDQYALGITVYEWLSGNPPFNGTPYELMGQHVQDPPPSLRHKIPTLSPAVEQVVLKALEKDHQKRFESVREFAQALVAAVEQTGPVMPTIASAIKAATLHSIPSVPQRAKRQWIDEGDAHYDAGRYKEAIAAYSRAIQLDPRDADIYFDRGRAYYDLKEYRQAIADYDRAITLNPNYAFIYCSRGNAYQDLNEHQKAIADFNRAIQLDSNSASMYCSRGNAYRNLKEYQKAIADFNCAIQLDHNYAVAYYSRGKAYYALKEYQWAIASFDRALELKPNFSRAKNERAKAYARNIFQI